LEYGSTIPAGFKFRKLTHCSNFSNVLDERKVELAHKISIPEFQKFSNSKSLNLDLKGSKEGICGGW
jgi:hypothetical protein